MKYLIYISTCLLYLGLLYPICFVWEWCGWWAYICHILCILLLTIIFLVILGGLVVYFYREPIWYFIHDEILVPILVYFVIIINPFEWFSGSIEEKIKSRLNKLRYT